MIEAYGNELIERFLSEENAQRIKEEHFKYKKISISKRFISDCEMIANGGFSPLKGFMGSREIQSVLDSMKLLNGLVWSIPIPLHILEEEYNEINECDEVLLVDENGNEVAVLVVEEKFELDLNEYCQKVFKSNDINHPGVAFTHQFGKFCISGEIFVFNVSRELSKEEIEESYYCTPKELREEFSKRGFQSIVAFQTRNPIHRAHEYLIKCALESKDAVLIHPIVGETKSDDIPPHIRMKCYEVLMDKYFNLDRALLSVLPAAMRYAGPREAIHHLIIRQNYGCTHMIIGRDHAGVAQYYGTYEAQELVKTVCGDLKIEPVFFDHSFYCKRCGNLASIKTCPHSKEDHIHLSGTKVREMLQNGITPPKEFSREEVADILIKWAQHK